MLGAKPDADQAGRDTAQQRPLSEKPQQQRRRRSSGALEHAPNHPVLDEQLEALRRASRELPTPLDRPKMVLTGGSLQQARG